MEIKDTTEKKRLQEYIATIQNIAENLSLIHISEPTRP